MDGAEENPWLVTIRKLVIRRETVEFLFSLAITSQTFLILRFKQTDLQHRIKTHV